MNMIEVKTPDELLAPKARRGKWTAEEEIFVERIVEDFNLGILDVQQGTTLRNFLSCVLNCDPMRITKKYTGNSSIGKRAFLKADEGTFGIEYIQMRRNELQGFKLKWYQYLNNSQSSTKPRSATKSTTKNELNVPNSLLDMKLASCSSTAEFSELNMNPSISYDMMNNLGGVGGGVQSLSSLRNSSYDQLVDLDPTCNLGLRQGQEKMAELEKSISRLPSSSLHHSVTNLEFAANFGFLNPNASLASLTSMGNQSRDDLNTILAASRRNSMQSLHEGNVATSEAMSTYSSVGKSKESYHEYLANQIAGVGMDYNNVSTVYHTTHVDCLSNKRSRRIGDDDDDDNEDDYKRSSTRKFSPNRSEKLSDDNTSRESTIRDSNDNDEEDISNLEKLVIERSAGVLMKMC